MIMHGNAIYALIFIAAYEIAGVSLLVTLAHGTETGEWRRFFGIGLPALAAAFVVLSGINPSEKEIVGKGLREETGVRYVSGNPEIGPEYNGPTAYLENAGLVPVAMDRVTVSRDGENRAVRYRYRRKCFGFIDLGTFCSEYRLELTTETMQKAGIF